MLRVEGITAGYGDIETLHGVSLDVREGEIVTLLGANGAGKTTTLKTIVGLLSPKEGQVSFYNDDITRIRPDRAAEKGIILVPEGRRIFPGLTVLENLELGACSWRKSQSQRIDEDLDRALYLFPRLAERKDQLGWSLSGGEQQMLALARGLMGRPRLFLLDEPSLGLAPKLVEDVFLIISQLHEMGVTILLVEQNAYTALEIASRAYVLQTGRIVLSGDATEIANDPAVQQAYLSA